MDQFEKIKQMIATPEEWIEVRWVAISFVGGMMFMGCIWQILQWLGGN